MNINEEIYQKHVIPAILKAQKEGKNELSIFDIVFEIKRDNPTYDHYLSTRESIIQLTWYWAFCQPIIKGCDEINGIFRF